MLNRIFRLASTFSDYTVGTAIVLTHLALAGRRKNRRTFVAGARPRSVSLVDVIPPAPRRPAAANEHFV